MSMLRMDVPVNYVHRVRRTRVAQVPSDWKKLPDFRKVLYMALSAKAIVTQTLNTLQSDYDNDDGSVSLIMDPPEDDGYELPVTFDSQ